MEKLNNPSEISLIFRYALKDLSRNYKKISSIIATLFISLFILSAIFTIEDSLKKELNDNAKALCSNLIDDLIELEITMDREFKNYAKDLQSDVMMKLILEGIKSGSVGDA